MGGDTNVDAPPVSRGGGPIPGYLATLNRLWSGHADSDYSTASVVRPSAASTQATADVLAEELVDLIVKMTAGESRTPDVGAAMIANAHHLGEPAWAAAGRGVLACYWMRVAEEPAAIAELLLAEVELADARAATDHGAQMPIVPSGEAAACNNLGVAHSQLGYFEVAEPHLSTAARISAATYRGAFATQALVDIYNLAEFELRWALQLLGLDRDAEAIQRAESALEHCTRVRHLLTPDPEWTPMAQLVECLSIGARSIIEPADVCADDESALVALERSDIPHGPDTAALLYATQARVRRLLGDPDGARNSARAVARRATDNDRAMLCVAWREAALANRTEDTATATATYAAVTAQALDAMRRRAVRDFQARVELARLERQHAHALATAALLQEALDSASVEEARLLHAATHDALTQLPNRALLTERLHSALEHARAEGHHAAVAFVDVNELKVVNDREGHAAGDRLVCRVAEALRSVTGPRDTVARVGGDEFIVVLVSRRDEPGCLAWVDQLSHVLQRPDQDATAQHPAQASAGVCVVAPTSHLTDDEILFRADQRMYEAKSARSARPRVEILT